MNEYEYAAWNEYYALLMPYSNRYSVCENDVHDWSMGQKQDISKWRQKEL